MKKLFIWLGVMIVVLIALWFFYGKDNLGGLVAGEMNLIEALIIFVAIGFGYLLRDGNIKAIEKKNKHVIEEIKKEGKSEVLDYIPPEDPNKTAEQIARANAEENI